MCVISNTLAFQKNDLSICFASNCEEIPGLIMHAFQKQYFVYDRFSTKRHVSKRAQFLSNEAIFRKAFYAVSLAVING